METKDRLSRIAPLAGVLFVVLELAGAAIGAAGGRTMAALGDPTSKIVKSFADPVGIGVWIGAYLEFASLAAFAVFAAWILRTRRGPLATVGLTAAGVYVATTIAALVAGDAISYGSHHGLSNQTLLGLFYLQSGLFFATWAIAAVLLVLLPAAGWLRHSAMAIAVLLLVAAAFPTAGPSQLPNMLFLLWVAVASVSLARRRAPSPSRAPLGAPAT
jgi:hypothetical protein